MKRMVILLSFCVCFGCGCGTEPKFERNPNLFLLLDNDGNTDYFNPVWSPDGGTIYYLRGEMDFGMREELEPASLWAIDVTGENNRQINEGRFGALAISPSGDRLAVTKDASVFEGGLLVLMDTLGANEEIVSTSSRNVLDVEFSSDGSRLFYYADSAFYSIQVNGEDEQILLKTSTMFSIDISPGDSILFYHGWAPTFEYYVGVAHSILDGSQRFYGYKGFYGQFHPTDSNRLVYAWHWTGAGLDLEILDISTGQTTCLNAQTYPVANTFGFPSWSQDGSAIVFSSSGLDESQGALLAHPTPPLGLPLPFELWILW